MSHVSQIKLKVYDMLAMGYTASEFGLELRQQSTYKSYPGYLPGQDLPAEFRGLDLSQVDYAICNPVDPHMYEIGLKQLPDGSYALLYDKDMGGNGLDKIIGKGGINLICGYEKWAYKNLHPTAEFMDTEDDRYTYTYANYQ